jgi:HAE1 family hydrophobic/amphiphilic exporter-1
VVKQLFAKTYERCENIILTPQVRLGTTDGFELKIEDKGNDDWQTVSKVSNEFLVS